MKYDIVIVGGGIVGLFLANLLADKTSWKIAIIDPEFAQDLHPYDPLSAQIKTRIVSAINYLNIEKISAIIDWQTLPQAAVSPFKKLEAWSYDSANSTMSFACEEAGFPRLGDIVDNAALKYALSCKLRQSKIACLAEVYHSHSYMSGGEGVEITLSSANSLQATCIIASDGALSKVRAVAQFPVSYRDYHQEAIVCTVRSEKPHEQTASQIFHQEGPLAFLPLHEAGMTCATDAQHLSSLVWTVSEAFSHELCAMDDVTFIRHLEQAFEYKLGALSLCDERRAFPLFIATSKNYVKDSIILVGDAAHHIHPLAGQGLNLGLADAAALAQMMLSGINTEHFCFDAVVFHRYQSARRAYNFSMLAAVELIQRTTRTKSLLLKGLMSRVFYSLNDKKAIKKHIMAFANGV